MLVYTFDHAASFPILESYTTVRGPVTVSIEIEGNGPYLRVRVATDSASSASPENAVVSIALPLLAVGGEPEQIEIEMLGDDRGHKLFLEAADGAGKGCVYCFSPVDSSGWQTYKVDALRPADCWDSGGPSEEKVALPPLLFQRLGITIGPCTSELDLGLKALRVTGNVRLVPPGIAGTRP